MTNPFEGITLSDWIEFFKFLPIGLLIFILAVIPIALLQFSFAFIERKCDEWGDKRKARTEEREAAMSPEVRMRRAQEKEKSRVELATVIFCSSFIGVFGPYRLYCLLIMAASGIYLLNHFMDKNPEKVDQFLVHLLKVLSYAKKFPRVSAIFLVLLLVSIAISVITSTGVPFPGRYSITNTRSGVIKIDRWTGKTWFVNPLGERELMPSEENGQKQHN